VCCIEALKSTTYGTIIYVQGRRKEKRPLPLAGIELAASLLFTHYLTLAMVVTTLGLPWLTNAVDMLSFSTMACTATTVNAAATTRLATTDRIRLSGDFCKFWL
jgi:hypothetical protein